MFLAKDGKGTIEICQHFKMHLRSFFKGAIKAFRISCPVTSANLPIRGQSPLKSRSDLTKDALVVLTFQRHCLDQKLVSVRVGKRRCPLSKAVLNHSTSTWPAGSPNAGKLCCISSSQDDDRIGRTAQIHEPPKSLSSLFKSAAPSNKLQLEWLCAKTSKPTQG